jgi:hypothetical protein
MKNLAPRQLISSQTHSNLARRQLFLFLKTTVAGTAVTFSLRKRTS